MCSYENILEELNDPKVNKVLQNLRIEREKGQGMDFCKCLKFDE